MALAAKHHLTKRVAAVVVICVLLSLIWFNADSGRKLRQTYHTLSHKQAKQPTVSTASASTGGQQPGSHAKPHDVTSPAKNTSDESPDIDAQSHRFLSPPIELSDELSDPDAQPDKVTSPPIELSDESPDPNTQPHEVISPPIIPPDVPQDGPAQPQNGTYPLINDTYGTPAGDAKSDNLTAPLIDIASLKPFPPLPPPDDDEYMAICMAVKDQHLDLPEFFVHHYFHLGIRRFYVFDDGSEPPLSTVSYPIPSSAITWVYFQPHVHSTRLGSRGGIQERYYTGCLKIYGVKHTWMGFLDADEFLEMTGGETLSEFLHDWERNKTVGAVAVNWLNHNSAGLLTRPAEGPRKAYNRCIIDNPHNDNIKIKTFVRPALFSYMRNCHCVDKFKDGALEVGENGDPTTRNCDRLPITRDRWALHHFGTKSREEFLQKQERGKIRGGKSTGHFWKKIENEQQRDCLELTKYVP